jgi:anti-sigma regulatory factor (Ser/Thr protein kinase)
MDSLILPAVMESLGPFRLHVLAKVEEKHLAPAVCAKIELVLEEALTNIIHYAYPGEAGNMEVRCRVEPEQVFHLEILDWGGPFDPLARDAPDIDSDPEARKVGGLGIMLLRGMVDEIHYRREANKNILTIRLALAQ